MILCVCRGVSEGEIVDAIRCGARCVDDVTRRCAGAGGDCGSCVPYIEECLALPSSGAGLACVDGAAGGV